MLGAVEKRFGRQLPTESLDWLTDNGSAYRAHETRAFARLLGLELCTTAVRSPESNGIAESFVKTIKRGYISIMPKPDSQAAVMNLALAFSHYNEHHPHSALGYRSPREYIRRKLSQPQESKNVWIYRVKSNKIRTIPEGALVRNILTNEVIGLSPSVVEVNNSDAGTTFGITKYRHENVTVKVITVMPSAENGFAVSVPDIATMSMPGKAPLKVTNNANLNEVLIEMRPFMSEPILVN